MADYTQPQWLLVVGAKNTITSTKALFYAKASKCKGLAKFLMSPECRHYLRLGMRFIGVEYNSDLGAKWFVKDGVQDLEAERVPILNSYGDWALFAK